MHFEFMEGASVVTTLLYFSIGRGWDGNLKSYTIFLSCLRFGGHKPWPNLCGLECGKLVAWGPASLPSYAHELSRGETQWVLTGHAGLLTLLAWGIGFVNPRNSINWLNVLFLLYVYYLYFKFWFNYIWLMTLCFKLYKRVIWCFYTTSWYPS